MSSISANPNPNPKHSMQKERNSKKKRRNRKKKTNPNWLDLPEDVWFAILSKLKTIDVIENAQKVCMLFRKLCKHPSMFIKIDMSFPRVSNSLPYDASLMTKFAVDRSAGQLLDIYLEFIYDDETLLYIAQRSPNLRHLRLGHYVFVSHERLTEAVQKLLLLEKLQFIACSFSDGAVEAMGRALPALRSFSLIQVGSINNSRVNEYALAISTSMPNLHHLQLIGSYMTNEGLKAILDGCPFLESLDLRACFQIDLSGDLGERCKSIKHLRLPHDSTHDYDHYYDLEQEGFGDDPVLRHSDSDDFLVKPRLISSVVDFDGEYSDDGLEDEDSDDDLEDEDFDDYLEDEVSGDKDSDDYLEDEVSDDKDSVDYLEDEDSDDEDSDDHLEDEVSDDDLEDEDSDDNLEDEVSDDDLEDEDSDDNLEDEVSDDDLEDEDSDDNLEDECSNDED